MLNNRFEVGSKAEISVRGSSGLVLTPALYRPICFNVICAGSDASTVIGDPKSATNPTPASSRSMPIDLPPTLRVR